MCDAHVDRVDARRDPPPNDDAVLLRGDFRRVTDERSRWGWQSNETGSVARFRLRLNGTFPTLYLTYLRSYASFGPFRVALQAAEGALPLAAPLPPRRSVVFEGRREQFSLPEVAVFPTAPSGPLLRREHRLMKKLMRRSGGSACVDVYVENLSRARVKILSVASC